MMIPKVGASYLRLLGYRSALEQGRCFHYGIHVRRHFNRARRCYHQAWREGDHRALDYLIALEHRLGHRGEAYLGCGLKYETERQWSMALTCYGLALEYHHEGALLRLSMLYQADRYDSTERCVIPRDDRQAMRWLQYGAMQGSKHALDRLLTLSQDMGQAAYALGELMEDKRFAGKKTPSSAVSYYLQAAQLTHGAEGLADLHRLRAYWTEEMKNAIAHGHLQHARSFTSARPDHHRRTAIHLFYERTNQGDETAQQQLLQMGQAKAQEAWWIGQLYEQDQALPTALNYYRMAAQRGHHQALKQLEYHQYQWSEACWLAMAEVYRQGFQDLATSIKCLMYLFHRNYSPGQQRLYTLTHQHTEAAMMAGNLQEQHNSSEANSRQQAAYFYLRAVIKGHQPALEQLERLSTDWDDTIRYHLGCAYADQWGQIRSAAHLLQPLAKQGYHQATQKLQELATRHANNAYTIGQIYESNDDARSSLTYYWQAAKQRYQTALSALERHQAQWSRDQWWHMVRLYRETYDDIEASLRCLKYLSEQGDQNASLKLDQRARAESTEAWLIAQLDEEQANSEKEWAHACQCYALGMCNNHQRAARYLQHLAQQGDRVSQFYLGWTYYGHHQAWQAVINWCACSAEQGYEPAQAVITPHRWSAQWCLEIARCYTNENAGLQVDCVQALRFYERALSAVPQQAGLEAGQLLLDQVAIQDETINRACFFFKKASQAGSIQALELWAHWAPEASSKTQRQLGDFYNQGQQYDPARAYRWYWLAKRNGDDQARQRLQELTQTSTQLQTQVSWFNPSETAIETDYNASLQSSAQLT